MGLTFCSSTPTPDNNINQTDISNSIDYNVLILENTRLLIEDGSLSSLSQALDLLEDNSIEQTEQGEYLRFIAGSLLSLVFPLSEESNIRIINPKSGMDSEVVKNAAEGKILEIPNEDVSFFTLLVSSTAALHTHSDAVLERSLDILDTIYTPESKSYLPVYIRSYIFEKNHLYNQAFSGYLESLEIDFYSYPSEIGLIRLLIRNDEYKEALSRIEKIHAKYSKSIELNYLNIDALIGTNELEPALGIVSYLLAENPDNTILSLKYADILQKLGRNSKALYMLNSIETMAGESSVSVRIRASIFVNGGNYIEALKLLENTKDTYTDDPDLRELFGRILLLTGEDGEGRVYLENSLELNPDNLGSLSLLTEESIASKSWERASVFVEKLIEKEVSDRYLRYGVEIYHNLGNNKKALDYSLKIINNGQPSNSDFYIYIEILLKDGKTKSVIDTVDRWILNSDSSVDRSYFYYLKSLAMNDPNLKLDVLRQSLFENLQNLDAIIAISDSYYKLDEKRNAYRYLKQALILMPGDETIKEKLRKLEKEL